MGNAKAKAKTKTKTLHRAAHRARPWILSTSTSISISFLSSTLLFLLAASLVFLSSDNNSNNVLVQASSDGNVIDHGRNGLGTIRGSPPSAAAAGEFIEPGTIADYAGQHGQRGHGRRLTHPNTTVQIMIVDVEYEATPEHPDGYSQIELNVLLLSEGDYVLNHTVIWNVTNGPTMLDQLSDVLHTGDIITFNEQLILIDNDLHIPREVTMTVQHSTNHQMTEFEL